jgi:hypothetical protein
MMADDEDIPANFPVEDNDLPEDDHLPEDEPVRKRRLLFYTLEQKKNIVHECCTQLRPLVGLCNPIISPSCWLSSMLCYKKKQKSMNY